VNKCNVVYVVQIFGNGNGSYARGCMDSSSPKMKEFKKCSAFKVKECRTIKTGTKKVCFLHPSDNMGIMQMFCMHGTTLLSKL